MTLGSTISWLNGASVDGTVFQGDAGLLGQNGFGIDGGHAKEGDDPHPEDGAGTAGQDGAAGTHDVPCADLRGASRGERLEGTHATALFATVQAEFAEDVVQILAETANLHKIGADGEKQASDNEKRNQDVVRQIVVDSLDYMKHCVHFQCPFSPQGDEGQLAEMPWL